MVKKSFKTAILAAALMATVLIPVAVSTVEAATLSVSHYVIEKGGKSYSLDLESYLDMKAGQAPFLQGFAVKHLKSSAGKVYKLNDYTEAKAAIAGGNMNSTLQMLEQAAADVNIAIGEVVIDAKGNITLKEPDVAVEADFKVMSIE